MLMQLLPVCKRAGTFGMVEYGSQLWSVGWGSGVPWPSRRRRQGHPCRYREERGAVLVRRRGYCTLTSWMSNVSSALGGMTGGLPWGP